MQRLNLFVYCLLAACVGCSAPALVVSDGYPEKPRKTVALGIDTETVALESISRRGGQRWQDIAGRWFRAEYSANFNYAEARVQVSYRKRGPTFAGRLTAKGLKPNFAYQLKLVSDRSDKWTFETLGKNGRWFLQGGGIRGTNFKDAHFRRVRKNRRVRIQSYIIFDYFVTDRKGRAALDFEADSSYHVIWSRQLNPIKRPRKKDAPIYAHTVKPYGPAYWRPDRRPVRLHLWFEHEWVNPRPAIGKLRLPEGTYRALVQITEESFHMRGQGSWAQVMQKPVEFQIDRSNRKTKGAP